MRVLALDYETNGKDVRSDPDFKVMGYAIYSEDRPAEYISFGHRHGNSHTEAEAIAYLQRVISQYDIVIAHNAKFEYQVSKRIGVHLPKFYCTMLMAHFIDENLIDKGLNFLGKKYVGEGKAYNQEMQNIIDGPGWGFIPVDLITDYAKQDTILAYKLFWKLLPEFKKQGFDGELWDYEEKFVRIIATMEQTGVEVDADLSRRETAFGQNCMQNIELDVGGSPSSSLFLERTFFGSKAEGGLGLKVNPKFVSEKTGKPLFNKKAMAYYEEELEVLNNPIARMVLEYRGWQKALSTYYKAFLEKADHLGRVHSHFNHHRTTSTRLSSSEPNFQNIPRLGEKPWNKNTKKALKAAWGWTLFEYDYSNLELRLGAEFSGEQDLIDAFNRDEPIWEFMMDMANINDKNQVKMFTYMTAYGAGLPKIAAELGITEKEAKVLKKKYFKAFPKFDIFGNGYNGKAKQKAAEQGYIKLWTGRRRHFQYAYEHRKAWNAYLQGGAAEIVKRAIIRVAEEVCDQHCRLVLTVHDSIVLEIKNGYENDYHDRVLKIMSEVPELAGFVTKFTADMHVWGE